MIIIETTSGQKLWTEKYSEENGFVKFTTTTMKGKEQQHQVNKTHIVSISDIGEVEEKREAD